MTSQTTSPTTRRRLGEAFKFAAQAAEILTAGMTCLELLMRFGLVHG